MKNVSQSRRRIDILTPAEVGRMMAATGGRSALGARDRAMIAVLWRCQLRISELLSLFPDDYSPQAGSIRVQCGKGGKLRTVGIDPFASAAVDAWLAVRPKYARLADSPLFCSMTGKKISRTSWGDALKRYAQIAGITKRVHPHGLRHTGACELAAEIGDIRKISRQLGHANIAVTHRYLDHLSPQDVIDAVRARRVDPSIFQPTTTPRFPVDPIAGGSVA